MNASITSGSWILNNVLATLSKACLFNDVFSKVIPPYLLYTPYLFANSKAAFRFSGLASIAPDSGHPGVRK